MFTTIIVIIIPNNNIGNVKKKTIIFFSYYLNWFVSLIYIKMDLVFVLIIIFQNCNRQNPMWHVLIKDHIDRVKLKDLLKIAKYLIKHTLHRIDSFFLVNCSNSGSICKLFNHFQFKACINLKIKNS